MACLPTMKSATKSKKSTSGRNETSQTERFRAKVWYWAVRHYSQLLDYGLDMQFGQADGPMKSGGSARNRVFGTIKNGTVPSRGNHPKRKFDLIERVGAAYPQTVGYFDSYIWELFNLEPHDLQATNQFLIKCFKTFEVALLKGKSAGIWAHYAHQKQESGFEDLIWNRFKLSSFEMSLINTIDAIPNELDALALIGALYRKYHLEFNHPRAEKIKAIFNRHLSVIADSGVFEKCGGTFHALATMAILCGRKGAFPSRKDRSRYGDEESADYYSSGALLVCNKNPSYRYYRKHKKEIAVDIGKRWAETMTAK